LQEHCVPLLERAPVGVLELGHLARVVVSEGDNVVGCNLDVMLIKGKIAHDRLELYVASTTIRC